MTKHGLSFKPHIRVIEPVGFFEMLELERRCRFVVTDSGGVQKEAFFFAKPCITLRDQTEWVETVRSGWNIITGVDGKRIRTAFNNVRVPDERPQFYGDGTAGRQMLEILSDQFKNL
jgi:UDP-GlcNAc3NAcA epimerase